MTLNNQTKEQGLTWLALFTSMSTLLCCALPIVLVSLGLGTTYAALTNSAPWIVTLGEYKAVTFTLAGVLIASAIWFTYRPGRSCPSDPLLAAKCQQLDKWNRRILIFAAIAWCIGFFAAYLALPIQLWLEG